MHPAPATPALLPLATTQATLPDAGQAGGLQEPALIIVGDTVGPRERLGWLGKA